MGKLQINDSYESIESNDIYVNGDNDIISEKDLNITPFDVIKATAKKLGQEIKDPNPSCNSCYGRGYIGRDSVSKSPIPCSCIYINFKSSKNVEMFNRARKLSRKDRRQLAKSKRRGL
jgi:hypothetical protein